jgi:CheY-like chemotaxis protein
MPMPPSETRSVLVIDDDPAIRDALAVMLETSGFRTLTAANGAEGLSILGTREQPRLILLDLAMPVMDGVAFQTALRGDTRHADVPVILITAEEVRPDQVAALNAVAVLRKPFGSAELDELLERYVT